MRENKKIPHINKSFMLKIGRQLLYSLFHHLDIRLFTSSAMLFMVLFRLQIYSFLLKIQKNGISNFFCIYFSLSESLKNRIKFGIDENKAYFCSSLSSKVSYGKDKKQKRRDVYERHP